MDRDKIEITTAQYVNINYTKAGLETRIFALIVDRIIQCFAFYFIIHSPIDGSFAIYIPFVVIFMNFLLEYFMNGQTLGKKLFKIYVISDNCTPPTFLQCLIRFIIYNIDVWVVGVILIGKKGQRLGDMASGCYVVCKKSKKNVKANISQDYKYVNVNYQPEFSNFTNVSDKEIDLAVQALYSPNYVSQQNEIASILKKRLNITTNLSGYDFLLQLTNDYNFNKYIKNN